MRGVFALNYVWSRTGVGCAGQGAPEEHRDFARLATSVCADHRFSFRHLVLDVGFFFPHGTDDARFRRKPEVPRVESVGWRRREESIPTTVRIHIRPASQV